MLWSAIVCFRKKSVIAGSIAVLIILFQGAMVQPWHSQVPYNADDPDELEDIRQGHQISLVWMGFSVVSVALVMLSPIKRRKETEPSQ